MFDATFYNVLNSNFNIKKKQKIQCLAVNVWGGGGGGGKLGEGCHASSRKKNVKRYVACFTCIYEHSSDRYLM